MCPEFELQEGKVPMKITVITHNYQKGGMEKVIRLIFTNLQECGYDMNFVLLRHEHAKFVDFTIPEIIDVYQGEENRNIIKICQKVLALLKGIRKFMEYLKEKQPNVIIAINPFEAILSILCKQKLHSFKVLCWFHGPFEEVWKKSRLWKINKFFLKKADGFLLISNYMKEEIKEIFPMIKSAYVVLNPILASSDKYIQRDKRTFIFVGRLSREKNVDLIIEAFSGLKEYDFSLEIYGDGEEKHQLMVLATERGINNRIIWHGWCDDPWKKIEKACAIVLASEYEGMPLVLLEANWYGVPFVTSDLKAAREVLVNNVNGCIFKKGDAFDLARTIKRILHGELNFGSPEEIRKCVEKFKAENVISNFETAISDIVGLKSK